jgi:hypothetical protein
MDNDERRQTGDFTEPQTMRSMEQVATARALALGRPVACVTFSSSGVAQLFDATTGDEDDHGLADMTADPVCSFPVPPSLPPVSEDGQPQA